MAEVLNGSTTGATFTKQQAVAADTFNTYTNCLFNKITTKANGGAMNVATTGRVLVSGSTFSNNIAAASGTTKKSGGGVYFSDYAKDAGTATVDQRSTFSNSLFIGNCATSNGGGLYIGHYSYMYLEGSTFSQNYSTSGYGGAMWIGAYGIVSSSKNIVIDANTAARGGAINFSSTNTLNNTWTMTNNVATNGGAIYEYQGTLTIASSANLTISGNTAGTYGGGIFTDFRIDMSSKAKAAIKDNLANSGGGGIYLAPTSKQTTNLYNTLFSGNRALVQGGGIYAATSTAVVNVNASTFTGNAAEWGGAIYNRGTMTIKDSRFLTFSDDIYNNGGTLTFTGSNIIAADIYSTKAVTVTGSTLNFTNTHYITITGGLTGAATLNFKGENVCFAAAQDLTGFTVSYTNSKMTEDYYVICSGITVPAEFSVSVNGTATAVGAKAGDYTLSVVDGTLVLSKTALTTETSSTVVNTVVDNIDPFDQKTSLAESLKAGNNTTFDAALDGSVVSFEYDNNTLTGTRSITGNGSDKTILSGKFRNNGTLTLDKLSIVDSNPGVNGGAIYNTGGKLTVSNSVLSGNSAESGSAIYSVDKGNQVTLTNSTVSCNTANQAGAIYVGTSGTLIVDNSLITGNVYTCGASHNGTAINLYGSKLTMTGSTVSDNFGQRTIFDSGVQGVDISNTLFQNNISGNNAKGNSNWGGGYCVVNTGSTIAAKDFNFTSVVFNSNTAGCSSSPSNCYGGAIMIYRYNGTFNIKGCDFTGNYAAAKGGAVAFNNGTGNTVLIENSNFTGNYCAGSAGSLYISSGYNVTISGSTFTGNIAAQGGAIYNASKVLSISGSTFTANSAGSGGGGAIYNAGTMSVENSVFEGNSASSGGAIRQQGAATLITTIKDCSFLTITDNVAATNGSFILRGSNVFGGNLYSTKTIDAAGSTITFINQNRLNTLTGTLSGAAAVNFNGLGVELATAQDFSTAAVSVSCDLTSDVNMIVITTGEALTFDANQTFTVYDTSTAEPAAYTVKLGEEVAGSGFYLKNLAYDAGATNVFCLVKDEEFVEEISNCVTTIDDLTNKRDGLYSLREAAVTYQAAEGATNVTFDSALNGQEIDFSGDVITLKADSTWTGNGVDNTILKGSITNSGGAVLDISNASFRDKVRGGRGGVVNNLGGSTVNLTGVKLSGYDVGTYYGGAVYNESGIVSIKDSVITGNMAAMGAAVCNTGATSSITLSGSTISGNTASNRAAIYSDKGTLTIENSLLTGNLAEDNAGLLGTVIASPGSNLVITGSTVSDNTGMRTVTHDGNNDLTFDGNLFQNNYSFRGAATNSNWGGALAMVNANKNAAAKAYSLTNSEFIGNTVTSELYPTDCSGGALMFYRNNGNFTIDNCNFTGNYSSYKGGAISFHYGTGNTATVSNSTFSGNVGELGGAIFAYSGYALTIKDSKFLTSSDTIYAQGALTLSGSNEFAADIYSTKTITATGSTATFINTDTITVTGALKDLAAINFNGKTVEFAKAQDFSNTAISITADLTAQLTENLVIAAGDLNLADGKLVTLNGTQMAIGDNIAGTDYTLRYLGEQLLISAPGNKEPASNCVTIVSDTRSDTDFKYSLWEAVITYKKDSGVTKVTFADNLDTVKLGSLLKLEAGGTWSIQGNANGTTLNARIHNLGVLEVLGAGADAMLGFTNFNSSGSGAAIFAGTYSKLTVKNVEFTGNTSADSGGAVFVAGTPTVVSGSTISSCVFTGNTAKSFGGALFSGAKNGIVVAGGTFTGNFAGSDGGAVYLENQSSTGAILQNLTITGNTSGRNGGGIYSSVINTNNLTITGNYAVGNGGGVHGALFTANNCTIAGNTAAGNGGGIYSAYRLAVMSGTKVSGNYAAVDGGGAYVSRIKPESGALNSNVSGATFTGNAAGGKGGGVFLNVYCSTISTMRANVTNAVFDGNMAADKGGAIYNSGNATVSNTLFVNNTAANGGAVYNTGDYALLITGAEFAGNAAQNGGAVYNDGTLTIKNSTFETASDTIYNVGKLTLSGTNEFAAGIYSSSAITASGSTLNFVNTEVITVDAVLTGPAAISFNGAEVAFAQAQDFSKTAISISTDKLDTTGAQFASGNLDCTGTSFNITIGGVAIGTKTLGEEFEYAYNKYSVSCNSDTKRLEIVFNAATATETGSVTSGTAVKDPATGKTTGYAVEWTNATTVSTEGNQIYAGGGLESSNGTLILDGADLSGKIVYGGSDADKAEAGTKTIQIKSGSVTALIGGGMGSGSDGSTVLEIAGGNVAGGIYAGARNITGDTQVTVKGGVAGQQVYGGVLNADVDGGITVNLQAGTLAGNSNLISGGSRITSGAHEIKGEISVNVSGVFDVGTAETNLYGAGMAIASGNLNTGDISIEVSGGNLGEAKAGSGVFGGGFAAGAGSAVTSGNVTVDLTSGNFGNVFGGGWVQQGASSTVYSVTIDVSGNVTGSNIYGGGAHSNTPDGTTKNTTVGSVAINITDNTNLESVFAGGQITNTMGSDKVTGNATITVSGTYADGFTTNLYGEGFYGADTVNGISTLDLSGFTGALTGKVSDFDKVKFSGDGSATLSAEQTSTAIKEDGSWIFDYCDRTANGEYAAFLELAGETDKFELLADGDLLTKDSWNLFSIQAESLGSDWKLAVTYNGDAAGFIGVDEDITLGGVSWELLNVEPVSNDADTVYAKLVLSKKTI